MEPFLSRHISDNNKKEKLDSSKIRISYKTTEGFGIFIKRKFYEPKLHLKIIITKEGHDDVIFEFDIEQESIKRRNSKNFSRLMQT